MVTYLTHKCVILYTGDYIMKKLIIFLILLFVPFGACAKEAYPLLPDNLAQVCIARFGFDEAGSRRLYEKIPITDEFSAWMIGWFWDDYKIVIGITDEADVIYFNHAALTEAITAPTVTVSHEEGLAIAEAFLKTALGGHRLKLVSSKGYTYNFSEYYNGIRVMGHDATVVVDKSKGEVYYFKGFGKYKAEYKIPERRISESAAFDVYFENSPPELVYSTNYDSATRTKTVRPIYLLNNSSPIAVSAENGEIVPILMYDYNYYYNDEYYDPHFSRDNSINADIGVFTASKPADSAFAVQKLKNIFYALRVGYAFEATEGLIETVNGQTVPAVQVDIAPVEFKNKISEFSSLYHKNDFDITAQNKTGKEYLFARAYVNSSTGEIMRFSALPNAEYTYRRPSGFKKEALPRRVTEFITRAVKNSDELRLYSSTYINEYTTRYTFARYANGIRVIGEGAVMEFNSYANDVTSFYSDMSTISFIPLEGIKPISDMKQIIKSEVPYDLCYTDSGEGRKITVYDFKEKSAAFDPVSGNRIDLIDSCPAAQMVVCSLGSDTYSINSINTTAKPPISLNNRIYLPLRLMADVLGLAIAYEDGVATLSGGADTITVKSGSSAALLNGTTVNLSSSAVISDDTMYLSVNSIRQLLGVHIRWEEKSNKILVIN